jgi:4-cresol dehydrogenase (hydroxylating)
MSNATILPQGVSKADFDKAIAEFKAIVGADWVWTDPEHILQYTKIMIPADEARHTPSGALAPASVEEIQRILAVCNKYKVPVWTVSTGRNFGYGSASPATRGQMVMDLKRMNKIIEVDPDLCYALVEPGVTYKQLYDYIQEHNLPVWLSMPLPSAIAGPVGNTLDRGVGYTPYGEHFLFSCGMEVVMANGEILRTGMGGMPNSNTWQVFKWGYGPYLDGIFTQSNYGVVTKLGFWLMPKPPVYKPFGVQFDSEADIVKIIDAIRPLRIANIIPSAVWVSHGLWDVAVMSKRSEVYGKPGRMPDDVAEEIIRKQGFGIWNVFAALYGTPEQVEVNWKMIEATFKSLGGKILVEEEVGNDICFQYRKSMFSGTPTLREFGMYNWRGGGGSQWFAPVAQARGSETLKQMKMTRAVLDEYGIDYTAVFIVGWRDMHHVVDLLYDRTNPVEMKNAHDCYAKLVKQFAAEGYGIYRTSIAFMDQVADTFGPVKKEINRKIKRALDPNGILAPGKSGIFN